MPIQILIIDASRIVREGLRRFLVRDLDLEIVGEAGDGQEAIEKASLLRPDLIVIDLLLPSQEGVRTIAAIHQSLPLTPILVLSQVSEPATVTDALRAGAIGYLSKDIRASDLRAAVKAAAAGQVQFSPSLSTSVLDAVQPSQRQKPLTLREREILRLIVKGYTNKEIVQTLKILEDTVERHLRHILAKLRAPGRKNEAHVPTVVKGTTMTVYDQDRDLRYTWIYNPLKTCTPEMFIGKTDADLVLSEEAKRLTEIKQRVLQTGKGEHRELQTTSAGGIYMHDLTVDPLYDSHGTIIGVTGTSIAQPHENSARVQEQQAGH